MAERKHETKEQPGRLASTVEEAHALHHLATADPEPERGIGIETGPSHDKRFGLERAESSAAHWREAGVHPFENRALRPGDEGYDEDKDEPETAEAGGGSENAAAARAARK